MDFGKAIKDLGSCEDAQLQKAFSELGSQAELLSYKQQKQVGSPFLMPESFKHCLFYVDIGIPYN